MIRLSSKFDKQFKQLSLETKLSYKQKLINFFFDLKNYVQIKQSEASISYFSKNITFTLAIVSFFFFLFFYSSYFLLNIQFLPDKMPLVYDEVRNNSILVDKILFVLFYFIVLIIEVVFLYSSVQVYFVEKRFIFISWILFIIANTFLILYLIEVSKLLKLF